MKSCLIMLLMVFPLLANAQEDQAARCASADHQAFDFWIGQWEVTTPDGKPAGKNDIDKIQDDCVLRENWTSASSGFTGTSYNFYNSRKKQWQQLWVDNQGGNLELSGNRKDNQMILRSAEATDDKGESFFHRITWTHNEDGTVRQLWETIKNSGEITIAFDGLYKKAQ